MLYLSVQPFTSPIDILFSQSLHTPHNDFPVSFRRLASNFLADAPNILLLTYHHDSPGARSTLHKILRQIKLAFQWVLYGPKGGNSPGTGFYSVALTIWGGSKVNFPPRTLNKFKSFFAEFPEALIA